MKEDRELMTTIAILVLCVAAISSLITSEFLNDRWKREAFINGHAEYEKSTGRWRWSETEKKKGTTE